MLTQRNATATRPAARYDKLVVTETADEVLLYDTEKHHIHHLNATTAAVWRLCDGKHTVVDLAREAGRELGAEVDETTVRLALTKLDDAGLLKESLVDELRMSRMSRRTFMQRAGVAGAIAMPGIVSVTAASADHIGFSESSCNHPCESDDECVIGLQDCLFCISGACRKEPPSKGCGAVCKNNPSPCSSPCSVCGGPGQPQGSISCCNPATVDENDPCTKPGNQWNCAFIADGDITGWDPNGWPAVFNCGGARLLSVSSDDEMITALGATGLVASIGVNPSEGAAGDAIRIDGSGFEPGERVSVTMNGTEIGGFDVDDTGSGGMDATIPADATGGITITAIGQVSGLTTSASFTVIGDKKVEVVLNPAMTVTPAAGEAGTQATVSVSGFDPASSISISFSGAYLGDVANDSSTAFAVPSVDAGGYAFEATQTSNGASASAGFEVLPPPFVATPVVSVSATTLNPGDVLTVSVSGYHPDEAVTITLNGAWAADTGNGGSANLQMGQPGGYEVGATGGTTGAYDSVYVEVLTPAPQNQPELQQAPAAQQDQTLLATQEATQVPTQEATQVPTQEATQVSTEVPGTEASGTEEPDTSGT